MTEARAVMPTEQPPKDHIPYPGPREGRRKEARKNTDPERAVSAVVQAIAIQGEAARVGAARQDRRKAIREWIIVVLLGLTIIFLGLLMGGMFWQIQEMIALYGPIRDQSEAAKKTAAAAASVAEAADHSVMAVHRAWIAPRLAYLLAEPVVGKPLEMRIEYRNTGYEPADGVIGEFKALAIPPSELGEGSKARSKTRAFAEQCLGSGQWSGGSVVYPTFDSVRAYVVGFQLPDDLVDDDVARGEKLIVVQYCFRYRTFDIPRHSLVCYSYRKGVSPRYGLDLCDFEQRAN
jgi:hypothetical protein